MVRLQLVSVQKTNDELDLADALLLIICAKTTGLKFLAYFEAEPNYLCQNKNFGNLFKQG